MRPRPPSSAAWVAALTYAFLHLPLVVLVVFAFNRSRFSVQWKGFTLDWFARLAHRPDVLRALRLSVVVGLTSTALATMRGTISPIPLLRSAARIDCLPGRMAASLTCI